MHSNKHFRFTQIPSGLHHSDCTAEAEWRGVPVDEPVYNLAIRIVSAAADTCTDAGCRKSAALW